MICRSPFRLIASVPLCVVDPYGNLTARYEYDPYGQTVVKHGPDSNPGYLTVADGNPWRYTGAYLDSTGLYKMGERYYDPARGRFTQLDPLGGGYVYASDDPINRIDPSGLNDGDPQETGLVGEANCGCDAGVFHTFDDDDDGGDDHAPAPGHATGTEKPPPDLQLPPGIGKPPARGSDMPGKPGPLNPGGVDWPLVGDGLFDIFNNPPTSPGNVGGILVGCIKCGIGLAPGILGNG